MLHANPPAEWPAIGPFITRQSAQATSGNWMERKITVASRMFRLRACGRV
jgi:hypothetical protein